MIKFLENRYIKILIASLMLISCLIEVTEELGFHGIEEFGSHHGLALFALSHVIISFGHAAEAATTIDKSI
jgi:hypothetical protein